MSFRANRVNKLEYGNISPIRYDDKIRKYLVGEKILIEFDDQYIEEINTEKLREFLDDYENKKLELDDNIKEELKDGDIIEFLTEECEWAEENGQDFILYHIF